MESIKGLLKEAAGILKASGNSGTPILDAELLLVHVLNLNQSSSGMKFDRLKLMIQQERLIDDEAAGLYRALVAERSKGKPVQYITNKQEFMGLEFYVSENVLIPRPDTEITVEKLIELSKGMQNPYIIDMCTGSGAIAVSLAANIPSARLWAVDISEAALECCRTNVRKFGLEDRISVLRGDLFEAVKGERLEGKVDIVVSNPPYIATEAIGSLDINVRGYEPHLALDGGEDGLVYYRRIVKAAACFLKPGGILAFEIGYDQGKKVKNIMEESGYYGSLMIEKDLAGFDRCIWGYRR